MGVMQGGTYRLNDLQYALQRKRRMLIEYLLAKGGPFHKIHEHERKPLNLLKSVEANDMRMLQSRKRLRLTGKTAQKDPVFGQVRMEDFHRQKHRALTIPNLVHIPHSAASNQRIDAIAICNGFAGQVSHKLPHSIGTSFGQYLPRLHYRQRFQDSIGLNRNRS